MVGIGRNVYKVVSDFDVKKEFQLLFIKYNIIIVLLDYDIINFIYDVYEEDGYRKIKWRIEIKGMWRVWYIIIGEYIDIFGIGYGIDF